jgi:hypothetical protein
MNVKKSVSIALLLSAIDTWSPSSVSADDRWGIFRRQAGLYR